MEIVKFLTNIGKNYRMDTVKLAVSKKLNLNDLTTKEQFDAEVILVEVKKNMYKVVKDLSGLFVYSMPKLKRIK